MAISVGTLGNWFVEEPDVNGQLQAFAALDMLVTCTDSMWHPAAKAADIGLPMPLQATVGGVHWDDALFEESKFSTMRNYMFYAPQSSRNPVK